MAKQELIDLNGDFWANFYNGYKRNLKEDVGIDSAMCKLLEGVDDINIKKITYIE